VRKTYADVFNNHFIPSWKIPIGACRWCGTLTPHIPTVNTPCGICGLVAIPWVETRARVIGDRIIG